MKLRRAFIVHHAGDETVLVPAGGAGFSGIVRGNRTLGAILDLLKENTTEEALVASLSERFDAPQEAIRQDVRRVLTELRQIGALDG